MEWIRREAKVHANKSKQGCYELVSWNLRLYLSTSVEYHHETPNAVVEKSHKAIPPSLNVTEESANYSQSAF